MTAWGSPASGSCEGSDRERPVTDFILVDLDTDLARQRAIETFPSLLNRVLEHVSTERASVTCYVTNDAVLLRAQADGRPEYLSPGQRLDERKDRGVAAWTMIVKVDGPLGLVRTVVRAFVPLISVFGRVRETRPRRSRSSHHPLEATVRDLDDDHPWPKTRKVFVRVAEGDVRGPALFRVVPIRRAPQAAGLSGHVWAAFRAHGKGRLPDGSWRTYALASTTLIDALSSVFEEERLPFLSLTIVDHRRGILDLIGTVDDPGPATVARRAKCFSRAEQVRRDLPCTTSFLRLR